MVMHYVSHNSYYVHLNNSSSKMPVQGVTRCYIVRCAARCIKSSVMGKMLPYCGTAFGKTHFYFTKFTVSLLRVC
jgi:hypothetical protein